MNKKWIWIAPCSIWGCAVGTALGSWLIGITAGVLTGIGVSLLADRMRKK